MSDYTCLLIERHDAVLVVKVNRPGVLNALSSTVLEEIGRAFLELDGDPALGAAVLTGAEGAKKPAFAAGADIAEMARLSGYQLREHSRLGQRAFDAIERCHKPVVAAINGFALGGGLELALACHVRYAAKEAMLGQPEINLGIIPGFGGTQRLPRLIGRGRAYEMLLTGDMVKAEDALALGLVDRIFEAGELVAAAMSLAGRFAAKAPLARALIIDCVTRGVDMNIDDAQRLEADLFGVVGATRDVKEGLSAFLEKRQAGFEGT